MATEGGVTSTHTGRVSPALQRVLGQLPVGASERQAIEAGEIDAVIDYGSANVIVFPAARRALRDSANRASAAARKATLDTPAQNSILAALPRSEYRRLLPALEQVTLRSGDLLHDGDVSIRHVYFPVDCVVCLLTKVDSEQAVATGLVGYEGMVGVSLALGVGDSSVRAVVQIAGTAMRMPATRFSNEFRRGPQLQHQLFRYAQVKLNLARQTAACIASHRFEQRLACWLLMIDDRARSQQMLLTHEQIANELNVRRESVSTASGALSSRGLIAYSRGRISILNRKGLATVSCRCYRPIELADAARSSKAPSIVGLAEIHAE